MPIPEAAARQPSGNRLHFLLPALWLLLAGCQTQNDARVQTLLNQRGFGKPYTGDSNEQYYIGIGDSILVQEPNYPPLNGAYVVRADGVIHVPHIGDIFVAGLTGPDVQETLNRRFQQYAEGVKVDVSIQPTGQRSFYVHGEVGGEGQHPFIGGMTLFEVLIQVQPTILADDDSVRLIRADPVNPMVFKFDYDEMSIGGYSGNNVLIRENDIIYVPPNVLGYISIFLEGLLAPLNRVVFSLLNFNRLIYLTESFGEPVYFRGGGGRQRFGGGYGYGELKLDIDAGAEEKEDREAGQ